MPHDEFWKDCIILHNILDGLNILNVNSFKKFSVTEVATSMSFNGSAAYMEYISLITHSDQWPTLH